MSASFLFSFPYNLESAQPYVCVIRVGTGRARERERRRKIEWMRDQGRAREKGAEQSLTNVIDYSIGANRDNTNSDKYGKQRARERVYAIRNKQKRKLDSRKGQHGLKTSWSVTAPAWPQRAHHWSDFWFGQIFHFSLLISQKEIIFIICIPGLTAL